MQPPGGAGGLPLQSPRAQCHGEGELIHRWDVLSTAALYHSWKPGLPDQDLLPRSHGTSPRPGNVARSPTAASSPRPLTQTLIISAYNSLQTTSLLCFSFPALILPRAADSASLGLPSAGRGSTAAHSEQHGQPGRGALHRGIPERPGDPRGRQGCPQSCCKGRGELHPPKSACPAFIAWGAVYIPRRAALQGRVHPRWECFAGEVICGLQGR